MDDEHQLGTFTEEDITNFKKIQLKALSFLFVRDSLDYLLDVLYGFENYIVEKNVKGNKEEWRLRQKKNSEKTDPISIVDRIEEYADELSLDDRLFIYKVKNLITHLMRRLHVDEMYPKSRLKNKSNYLLEEHLEDKTKNKKERLVWLGSKEELNRLIEEWQKNQFIEENTTEKVLSNFCDKNGELSTSVKKERIRWCKKNTELVVFISEMVNSKYKFIDSEEHWVKVSKCFVNNDGSELNPDSLAVTYQKAKPKSKELILKIIKSISSEQIEK